MPKQLYKIVQFHGGLNSNSDARDIAENELSEATDVMVDELGKIRMMGGTAQHYNYTNSANNPNNAAGINPGYGLFQFSHDRLGATTTGSAQAETGDDYLAMADEATAQIDIYSRVTNAWGLNRFDLGSTHSGMKAVFYAADGALRVSDGNFGADNQTMWYGYIYRYFLGDGTSGYDGDDYSEGKLVTKWVSEEAAPKALAIQSFSSILTTPTAPTAARPISVQMYNYEYNDLNTLNSGDEVFSSNIESCFIRASFIAGAPNVTAVGGTNLTVGFSTFASTGDKIIITESAADNNKTFTVGSTSTNATSPNTMEFDETVAEALNDYVYMFNLNKMSWFDKDNTGWQCAVSTLYDDSKQESPLSISGTTLEPADIVGKYSTSTRVGMTKVGFRVYVYAGDGTNDGLGITEPRVSGFNVYMRRSGTDTWYQQANVDITLGVKLPSEETYTMWGNSAQLGAEVASHTVTTPVYAPQEVISYEDSSGMSGAAATTPFDGVGTGFKTAVIANRRAYVANFKAKDLNGKVQVFGDAIMKSEVGKFDNFSLDRRLEAEIRDGDEIVKLEEYADRLLQFKKKKMTLINISQEVEFIEDTFMHKGISHPAATCKTDFGIAWVNKQGCYLYDGQKVNNLLEKQGRQIIKESEWATFTTLEPMIGYIPKKRQLLIANDVTTTGDGATFLYDLVTQSWVEGAAATVTSEDKTNFITDWNGDLVYAHTAGTVVKWDDTGDDSTAFVIATKDIDFGQPGQKKKIYKVYVTYTGVSSLSVNVDYQINGDNGWNGFSSGEPLTASSGQNEATLTLSSPVECYSFQLRFSGTGKTTFEINDATIVFRLKGMR